MTYRFKVSIQTEVYVAISDGVRVALREFLFPFDPTLRNKIGAIKTLHTEMNIGLKEAKDIVDSIEAHHLD